MRMDDDEDEDDYEDDQDQDQDQEQEQEQEQDQDNEQDNEEEEDDPMNGDDEDGSGDNSDEDGSDDDEDDEDEDEDEDGDNDDDDDEEDDDDDEDSEGDGDGETHPRDRNTTPTTRAETSTTTPPHIRRQRELIPQFPSDYTALALEAIVGIPTPGPVHSIATSFCASWLLTGSQDGHIRTYDTWASANGLQSMTAQQRSVVGLGETINKAGVFRGWYNNEVENGVGEDMWKGLEPVYSLACQSDALWAASGTRSGPINLNTLRHSPGYLVHTLKGHTSVVSCLSILPGEFGLLSGSWDGTIRDWDLNTGKTSRTYYTHGAQISSLAMRPISLGGADTAEGGILVNVGPDFFEADRTPKTNGATNNHGGANGHEETGSKHSSHSPTPAPRPPPKEEFASPPPPSKDEPMGPPEIPVEKEEEAASPYDPLFDDDMGGDADAEGESVVPSTENTALPTPITSSPPPSFTPGLALPSASGLDNPSFLPPTNGYETPPVIPDSTPAPSSTNRAPSPTGPTPLFAQTGQAQAGPSRGEGAARGIPLLTRETYAQFSTDIMMTSTMDGQVTLMDRRVPDNGRVGRLQGGDKAPPWCMSACWSGDGNQVLAGRRNGTLDIWDVRRTSSSRAPNLLRTMRTPQESGSISCVVAFPDGRNIATASQDNIRLWNTVEYYEPEESMKKSKSRPPFKIVAGHHGGTISSMVVDPTCSFLFAASGDRGWQGEATKVVLIHDIKAV